ncbi:MAG: hypothetical protein V4735_01820 [Pseudomonadota bacterium]
MNATAPVMTPEKRREEAFSRLTDKAKGIALKTGKSWLSSFTGGLSDAGDFVEIAGDLAGAEKGGKGFFESIMEWFKPLIDWFKNLLGMIDHDATLAEKTVPEKISQSTAFKTMATKLGLKEEVGTDIQKIISESGKSYLSDGIPAFDEDGTQTNTINHVVKTHEDIVTHLVGVPKKSVGRLAQQYPDMPPQKREELAEQIASYVTGLPPQPADGYDLAQLIRKNAKGEYINISGGLAGTLLTTQAKAKGPNHPKDALQESDIPLVFKEETLNAAVAAINAISKVDPKDAAKAAAPATTPVAGGTNVAPGTQPVGNTGIPAAPPAPKAKG